MSNMTSTTIKPSTMSAAQASRKRSIDEVEVDDAQDIQQSLKRLRLLSTTTTTSFIPQQPLPLDDTLIYVSARKHQSLWDQLPFGVLFELARLSFKHNIDLEGIPRRALETLKDSNVAGIQKLAMVLGLPPATPVMDNDIAAALDWEGDCIVKDNGEMLEYRHDSQYRSGRVFFQFGLDIKSLVAARKRSRSGQSGTSAHPVGMKDILLPSIPRLEGSCLFTRVFGSHRFLRLKLLERLSHCSNDEDLSILHHHVLRPIHILGRTYRPLVEKDGAVFYYLEGLDYVGCHAEKSCNTEPGSYGLGRHIHNTVDFLNWWLPLEENQETLMCKLVTRLHLGLSETKPGLFMEPGSITVEKDIERNKFVFTDGCGMISEESGLELHHKLASNQSPCPSAYQIRVSTAKGIVQVAPKRSVEEDNGRWIVVTKSMLKAIHGDRRFPNGPVNNMHILDAAHYVTCVVKAARYSNPARLSAQLIPILCNQGVPEETIRELQELALNKVISSLVEPLIQMKKHQQDVTEHRRHRMALVKAIYDHAHLISRIEQEQANLSGFKKGRKRAWPGRDDWAFQEAASIPRASKVEIPEFARDPIMSSYEGLYLAVCSGFDILASKYFTNLWKQLTERAMYGSIKDFRIPLHGSAYCTILPDFTGELDEGYISFAPPENIRDATGKVIDFTQGSVLVGRHPALLPTDVQKVQLANVPLLRERPGVIFFSTQGSRPLADILAGGDYDGDEVILIWEECIVQPFHNANIDLATKPEAVNAAFTRESIPAQQVSNSLDQLHPDAKCKELERYLLASVKVPILLGKYYGYYLQAVERYGIDSEEARIMAHKFNILLDAPKTAHRVTAEAFKVDQAHFNNYKMPYHVECFSKKKPMVDKMDLPLTRGYGSLSNLAVSGLSLFKKKIAEIDAAIKPRNSQELFDQLIDPLRYVRKWAGKDPSKLDELKLVEAAVKEAQDEFYKIYGQTKQDSIERQLRIKHLTNWFHSNPSTDQLPLLAAFDYKASFLDFFRASYAYRVDHEHSLGDFRGFSWQIARTTLLGIIAEKQQPVKIPWEVFRRLKPHSAFCAEPDSSLPLL